MNASSQAITPELASKIAYLAVLFRTAFPGSTVDLTPWLSDAETQCQLESCSIDLSFYLPQKVELLACRCILMQVHFSEDLLAANCQIETVQAYGYSGQIYPEEQWQFSTTDWAFAGPSLPRGEHQERFKSLVNSIFRLFEHTNQVNTSG
ncbi:MAG: hypothetical protein AAGF66_13010 [Cyanobacteria bacterium P01_H01_bin.119]